MEVYANLLCKKSYIIYVQAHHKALMFAICNGDGLWALIVYLTHDILLGRNTKLNNYSIHKTVRETVAANAKAMKVTVDNSFRPIHCISWCASSSDSSA